MTVAGHIELALRLAIGAGRPLYDRWNSVMWTLHQYGPAIAFQMNGDIQTDVLLRELEAEALRRVTEHPSNFEHMNAQHFQMHLTSYWLLNTYEVVRSACQQAKRLGIENPKLFALRERLALVRIPLAKAEIAQANRAKRVIELEREHAQPDDEPIIYQADGSYMVPREMCGATGSLCWWVIDVKNDGMVLVSRQQLSNEMLEAFD